MVSVANRNAKKKTNKMSFVSQNSCIFAADLDAQWCNGSTTDSGSVSLGSNPGWATKNQKSLIDFQSVRDFSL